MHCLCIVFLRHCFHLCVKKFCIGLFVMTFFLFICKTCSLIAVVLTMRSVRNYYCRKSLASRLVPHYTALSVITWPCALVSALSDMFSLCIEQCAHTKSQWAHKKLFIFTICVECAVSEKFRVSLQN